VRLAVVANKGNYFVTDIGVELRLNPTAMKRVRALVIKTGGIYGIDAEKLHAPSVDQGRQTPDEALALKLPLIAGAGWESEERRAPVPVHNDSHIEAETMRIPPMIFPFHVAPGRELLLEV
jgi:hypothetical protein